MNNRQKRDKARKKQENARKIEKTQEKTRKNKKKQKKQENARKNMTRQGQKRGLWVQCQNKEQAKKVRFFAKKRCFNAGQNNTPQNFPAFINTVDIVLLKIHNEVEKNLNHDKAQI